MSAGMPGLGLGGLFFVLSALVSPAIELWLTLRGRSSRAAWRRVGRQLAIALTMIVALDLTLRAAFLAGGAVGFDAPSAGGVTVLPLSQLAVPIAALAALLAAAKGAQLVSGGQKAPDLRPAGAFSRQSNLRRDANGQEHHEKGLADGGHAAGGHAGERDGRERRPLDRQVRRRGPGHDRDAAELLDRGRQRGT